MMPVIIKLLKFFSVISALFFVVVTVYYSTLDFNSLGLCHINNIVPFINCKSQVIESVFNFYLPISFFIAFLEPLYFPLVALVYLANIFGFYLIYNNSKSIIFNYLEKQKTE